jgi:hypothetical protein
MAWEYRHGKTKKYFYKSRKVNGKVKKEYYGCGRTAELFAAADAERKFRLEQARMGRERLDELDRQITEFCQVVDGIAIGFLVSQGYYRHKGNFLDWRKRKRRGFKQFMELQISEESRMTLNTDKMTTGELRENLQQLVHQGETGDTNAIMALQPVVTDVAIYDHTADLGKEVKANLTFYMSDLVPFPYHRSRPYLDCRSVRPLYFDPL